MNADAALAGGNLPEPRGLHPTFYEQQKIRAIRDAHEKDFLARLQAAPPAAFIFLDKSPLISWQESVRDFEEHCPDSYAWVHAHYRQTYELSGYRVYLRADLADHVAEEVRDLPAPDEEAVPGDTRARP